MHTFDLSLFYFFYNFSAHNIWLNRTIVFLAEYLIYPLLLWIVILAYKAWKADDGKVFYGYCKAVVAGLAGRFVVASIIRHFYHHVRPFVALHLTPLFNETSYSFPSGHSIFLFALSTGVYFVNKKYGRILYGISFVICLARIAAGVHYPSDILGGMVLGILTAYCIEGISKSI